MIAPNQLWAVDRVVTFSAWVLTMNLKRILLAAGALIVAVSLASSTWAIDQYGFVINGNYGGLPRAYNYRVPTPPYFAVHPPVYYSHAVRRPYGLSPYAWPASRSNFARVHSAPRMVHNPFAPQTKAKVQREAVAASQPQMIFNPFVTEVNNASQLATSD